MQHDHEGPPAAPASAAVSADAETTAEHATTNRPDDLHAPERHCGPSSAPGSHRLLRRALVAVFGVLAAGLVLPAATKQWSDRAQELALKKEILTQVTEASTATIESSRCIVNYCHPEARVAQLYPSPEAFAEADEAGQRAINETLNEWVITSARTNVLLKTYFTDESGLHDEWRSFSDAVAAFIRLGTANCGEFRIRDMNAVRAGIPEAMDRWWDDLLRDIGPDCQQTPDTFKVAYSALADELALEQEAFGENLLAANSTGFSNGVEDFVRDLYPF